MSPGASPNLATSILQTIVGERPAPTNLAKLALKHQLTKIGDKILRPLARLRQLCRPSRGAAERQPGTGILENLFLASARHRITEHPGLLGALEKGLPPLGEHAE